MADTHRPIEQAEIIIEDESLRGGFTQIPNALLRRADVTAGAKITYMALLSYAWGKDRCFPGQETLANDVGAGRRSVIRYLQELQEVGLLEIKRRGLGLTNVYVLKKMAVTSRSAKMAHQEVPTSTHPEMPKWQLEEDKVEEDKVENIPSNIRKSNRSIDDFVDNTPSQPISLDANRAVSRNGSDTHHGVEGIGSIMHRVGPHSEVVQTEKRQRGRPRKFQDEESQMLLNYVSDFAREFADKATLNQSATRIVNLYQKWGKGNFPIFIDILYQARATTKAQNNIRTSKFAYFCSVLEDLLGLKEEQPSVSGHHM